METGGVIRGFIFNNASLSACAGGNRWGFLSGTLVPCLYFGKNRQLVGVPGGPPDKWTLALFRTTVSTKVLRRGNNWRESKQRRASETLRFVRLMDGQALGSGPGAWGGGEAPASASRVLDFSGSGAQLAQKARRVPKTSIARRLLERALSQVWVCRSRRSRGLGRVIGKGWCEGEGEEEDRRGGMACSRSHEPEVTMLRSEDSTAAQNPLWGRDGFLRAAASMRGASLWEWKE